MRSPAAAFAFDFGKQHRLGWLALTAYLAGLAALRFLVFEPGQPVTFDENWRIGLLVIVPLASTFTYVLAVFSFGLAGDLAERRSIYPARMLTLPVTNAALVGWPMLFGSLAMIGLWLATRLLAVWPAGAEIPTIWPALFAAVILAWTQALTWLPYPLPGLRVLVAVLWLALIGFVVLLALELEAAEATMLALLAPQLPIAYLVARYSVAKARRGDLPDWRDLFARHQGVSAGRSWGSGAQAQVWFEWRRHGRSLPALVAILLPFELSLLAIFRESPTLVFATLLAVLMTPPVLAFFVAATVRKSNPQSRDAYELTPFVATRPMSSLSLVAAKLEAAALSTLATWLLVLIAIPLALQLSGTSQIVIDAGHQIVEGVGTVRAVAIGLLGVTAVITSTWKQLVQSLFVGVSGRAWLVKASVFVPLALLTLAVPLVPWIVDHSREVIASLRNALLWICIALVGLKIGAAAWVATRLYDRELVSGRQLVLGALTWSAGVLALHGLLVWLAPSMVFRTYVLALVAILAVPLVRIAIAPLALSWNRHR